MSEIKVPKTQHPVHELITKRWSARAFSERQITIDELNTLFEAASWTASSVNEQPWKYLYAFKGTQAFEKMIEVMSAGNQPWAKNASVILISLSKRSFDHNGMPNRHHMHDVGAANTTLLLQAAHQDIYGHIIGGFHMEQAIEAFNIETDIWEIACFITIGYLDEPNTLDEPYRTREQTARTRKSVNEFTQKLES
ncbi:MAG: nitroreductase family protein [Flavobacteriales bacterium]